MSEDQDDEKSDGLDCFGFKLFLDDINGSTNRKKPGRLSIGHSSPRTRSQKVKDQEGLPCTDLQEQNADKNALSDVYELMNEGSPCCQQSFYSEKKNKKKGKNLTPETNHTNERAVGGSGHKWGKGRSLKNDFNIWGRIQAPKEPETQSKKTLTAYSESFLPEELGKGSESNLFDFNDLAIIRNPKKSSLIAPVNPPFDFFATFQTNQRKSSFQEMAPTRLQDRLRPDFPKQPARNRLSNFITGNLDGLISSLQSTVDELLKKETDEGNCIRLH
jgi:hypothetical protein